MNKQELLDAIEFNWQCLITTRAVFTNSHFGTSKEYNATSFYTDRNINVSVHWKNLGEFESKYNPKRLNYWHNANFVIRLYGILDEQGLFMHEVRNKSTAIQLIHILRNKVGAHQDGLKKPKERYLKEVNALFKKLNIKQMDISNISNFNLAIDGVMLKLRNALINDIMILYPND